MMKLSGMELFDNRLWHGCGNVVNELYFLLFIAFVVLLAIDLWCMLATAIVCMFGEMDKSLTLLKIFGALGIILMLLSNFTLWLTMYSPIIYKRLVSVVWSKRLRLLYFLTLGDVNVFLLNLYYIIFRYSQYELTQYSVNVLYSVLVMLPIINIPVYVAAIRSNEQQVSLGDAAKLYMRGRLATYLIQKDYSSLTRNIS